MNPIHRSTLAAVLGVGLIMPAFAEGQLYGRTAGHLWAFGE
jgi:hypothetical protein